VTIDERLQDITRRLNALAQRRRDNASDWRELQSEHAKLMVKVTRELEITRDSIKRLEEHVQARRRRPDPPPAEIPGSV
jgi:hypothetical protein